MKLSASVHLAMSGSLGVDLSDGLDCNTYLIEAGGDWLMFDAGAGRDTTSALYALKAEGVALEKIKAVFLTHGHADHSAGAAHLRERLGLEVICGKATAKMVTAGDEAAISLTAAKAAGGYPADFVYRACPVDRVIEDGERLAFNGVAVTALATPGHSHDHMAYLVEAAGVRMLVSGDALFHGGKVGVQNIYDCSVQDICESVRRIHALDFTMLLPGHGLWSLQNAHRHAAAAMGYVARLACPPSI
jgi:hydroxyacylglutathione hydrolase